MKKVAKTFGGFRYFFVPLWHNKKAGNSHPVQLADLVVQYHKNIFTIITESQAPCEVHHIQRAWYGVL